MRHNFSVLLSNYYSFFLIGDYVSSESKITTVVKYNLLNLRNDASGKDVS